jgi:hypothetical protein
MAIYVIPGYTPDIGPYGGVALRVANVTAPGADATYVRVTTMALVNALQQFGLMQAS